MTRRSPLLAALAVALVAGTVAAGAAAQWAWKDDNGRLVYSNIPPPPNVKASQIVSQPGAAPAAARPGPSYDSDMNKPAATPAASPAAPTKPKTAVELEAEFRKRQQERADSERKTQEAQQKEAAKAAECERARGYLRALEDGMRIRRSDAAGNQEYLDDAQRVAETERARKTVAQLCN